jgi:hypothetical protein
MSGTARLLVAAVILLITGTSEVIAQSASAAGSQHKIYTSADGVFSFDYPALLIPCKQTDRDNLDHWTPDSSCSSYIPVCTDDAETGGTAACVAFPINKSQPTQLEAAAFSVSQISSDNTKSRCLSGVSTRDFPAHTTKINGIEFRQGERDGVATGHSLDAYIYRTFHRDTCYELDIRLAVSNSGYSDPGTLKEINLDNVSRRLQKVLHSFRFLK